MYNFLTPNLIALAENISRVYEIAKTGNHTVKIVPSEHCKAEDIPLLYAFYGLQPVENADIIVELCYDSDAVLKCFSTRAAETLEDINKRIPIEPTEVSNDIDSASFTLLKTAVNKLGLGANDVLIIHRIAKSIATLAQSNKIKIEHIAEAIQYRSIN